MQVIFCGTGAGPFTRERASSGLVLQHDGGTLMLDCGPGAVRGAMQAGIRLETIEAVVLSHLHSDHVLDLTALVLHQRFRGWRLQTVYGPRGAGAVAGAATGFVATTPSRHPAALPPTVEISGTDEREICGFVVHSEETLHAPLVMGNARRLAVQGRAVVYSGDTRPNPATIVPLAKGADLLIHECYGEEQLQRRVAALPGAVGDEYYRAITSTHTEVSHAAAIARDAGVRRLALTHLFPWDETDALRTKAARVFDGDLVLAHDGLVLTV